MRPSTGSCKQPHSHRPWFSWGTSTTLTLAGKTIQLGRCNPGGSYLCRKVIDDNFLMQVVEEPTRKGVLLDLVLTNKEGLVEDVKVGGRLGCSDHEMVEFRSCVEEEGR